MNSAIRARPTDGRECSSSAPNSVLPDRDSNDLDRIDGSLEHLLTGLSLRPTNQPQDVRFYHLWQGRLGLDDGLQIEVRILVSCTGCIGFCSARKWCIL